MVEKGAFIPQLIKDTNMVRCMKKPWLKLVHKHVRRHPTVIHYGILMLIHWSVALYFIYNHVFCFCWWDKLIIDILRSLFYFPGCLMKWIIEKLKTGTFLCFYLYLRLSERGQALTPPHLKLTSHWLFSALFCHFSCFDACFPGHLSLPGLGELCS